ncbi:hypothetical protein OG216_22670 [Streptomycetaceae bacterium NBC_01309]
MTSPVHDALARAERSAVHWELRDQYTPDDPTFRAWLDEWRPDESEERWRSGWYALTAETAARGVEIRRARLVSEPVTDYIKYEHSLTFANVAAGERVRWLSRAAAKDLLFPALDGWLIDGTLILHHWDGAGRPVTAHGNATP